MKLLVFALVLLGCLHSSTAAEFQVEALYEMRQQLLGSVVCLMTAVEALYEMRQQLLGSCYLSGQQSYNDVSL